MKTKVHPHILLASAMLFGLTFMAAGAWATSPNPWSRSTTEASSCESGRCLATSQKSNIMQFCESLRDRAAWAQDWQCQNTAIFDDGNDRSILYELRRKPQKSLSAEERAILQAADRYGNVGFCGRAGGNATLIMHNGRPAVVTSAHMFYNDDGTPRCTDAELRNAGYMPNVSYYDSQNGQYSRDFTHRRVGLEMPPADINGKELDRFRLSNDDFIIFYLKEDITRDVMPNGNTRGAMRYASNSSPSRGQMHMIGIAPDIRQGLAVIQQTCEYQSYPIVGVLHTCDTISGSSGSMLAVMEEGELRLRGIHSGDIHNGAVVPATSDSSEWNSGTDFVNNRHLQ